MLTLWTKATEYRAASSLVGLARRGAHGRDGRDAR